ncbi:MAG TPA: 30S ribosomal protein S6 [Candidatus Paceibacterota bacterium]|nr:30S ribosomal protein S6 [Candidatus Paceibacterota bacterium]
MAENVVTSAETDVQDGPILRIYEVGYHIIPTVDEGSLEQIVSSIRSKIEQAGGSFIAEGAPAQIKLAYPMEAREGDKRVEHDRAYFGWVKFEAPTTIAKTLESELQADAKILRSIVFQTVREETRAKMKAPTLREVKRTDTIKATPRAAEEAAPVSEEDLDKALQDITTE